MLGFQYMIYCRHVCSELSYVSGSECAGLDLNNTICMQFYVIEQQINELLRVSYLKAVFFTDVSKSGTEFKKEARDIRHQSML